MVKNVVSRYIHNGSPVLGSFLDASKAFNLVDHGILFDTLILCHPLILYFIMKKSFRPGRKLFLRSSFTMIILGLERSSWSCVSRVAHNISGTPVLLYHAIGFCFDLSQRIRLFHRRDHTPLITHYSLFFPTRRLYPCAQPTHS